MDICQCFVNLGGDMRNVAHLHGSDAVSWAEVCVIRAVHGDENVKDILVVREEPRDMRREVEYLRGKFGEEVIAKLWPGMDPRIPLTAPEWVVRSLPQPEAQLVAAEPPKKRRRPKAEAIAPTTIVDPHELDAAL